MSHGRTEKSNQLSLPWPPPRQHTQTLRIPFFPVDYGSQPVAQRRDFENGHAGRPSAANDEHTNSGEAHGRIRKPQNPAKYESANRGAGHEGKTAALEQPACPPGASGTEPRQHCHHRTERNKRRYSLNQPRDIARKYGHLIVA